MNEESLKYNFVADIIQKIQKTDSLQKEDTILS